MYIIDVLLMCKENSLHLAKDMAQRKFIPNKYQNGGETKMTDNLKEILQSLLKEALEPIHEQLEQVNQRLDKADFRLDRIEQDTSLIPLVQRAVLETSDSIERIQDVVQTLKDNQQTVLHIQQEQQKILERLSVRSISHEADIAELRRIK